MGRNNQISSAQRQATQLHQQSAMQAKTSTQSAPIKQQQQQQKPTAAAARPASPQSSQAAQTQSKGQSHSTPMKQQQQQRPASPQMKQQNIDNSNNKNVHVYRPTPVQEHPDDAFLSGAWMFDAQRVPQWMASQLPVALATRMIAKQQQQSLASKSSTTGVVSGKQAKVNKSLQLIGWPTQSGRRVAATPKPAQQQSSPSTQQPSSQQQLKQQPTKKHQQQNGNVIALGSVAAKNASPDDAFFSGAWLFDAQSVPQWLASQLPVATAIKQSQNKKQNNSNGLRRPQSPGSRRT